MSDKFYLTPELEIIEIQLESVLCSNSKQLPGSNWIEEEEI